MEIKLTETERVAIAKALENEYFRIKNAGGDYYGPLPLSQLCALKNLADVSDISFTCKAGEETIFRGNFEWRNVVCY